MFQGTKHKTRAIRIAALSGLIITTPGWHKFQKEITKRSLYSILTHDGKNPTSNHFPGLGYLLLLETVLGQQDFRKLCPLILPVNEKSVVKFLPDNDQLTSSDLHFQDRDRIYQLLITKHDQLQQQFALRNWPSDIGPSIDQTLELILPPVLTRKDPWSFFRAFLNVRYGLSGTKPVTKLEELIPAVFNQVFSGNELGADAGSFDEEKTVVACADQLEQALQHPRIKLFLGSFAGAFSQKRAPRWDAIEKKALAQQSSNHDLSDLTPSTYLAATLSPQHANALEKRGLYRLCDLAGVTEEDLRGVRNLDKEGIKEIKQVLRKLLKAMRLREQDAQRRLDQEKRLARQHSL